MKHMDGADLSLVVDSWNPRTYIYIYNYIYMGVVQNTFSRTALNRSANRVATAVPQ